MLPICFGEATKISSFLLEADKTYEAVFRLGESTSSGDADGEIIARTEVPANLESGTVEQTLAKFTGEISQLPPMHSAIKKNGTPLYKLAHQGIEIERDPRTVTVFELKLLALEGAELRVKVHCSKGTYIRTLAEDIGNALGYGAHVKALRREQVGPFNGDQMHTLGELQQIAESGYQELDALLLPVEHALMQWPEINLAGDAAFYIQQGQAVFVPKMKARGLVRLYAEEHKFLGVGHILDDGRVAPKRLMNVGKMG
jgi:tRNA pseudouridine55 synthase